jgi:mannose-6-phosphate isomerase-like protein (cupin superfamily)
MSLFSSVPTPVEPMIVRAADAEVVGRSPTVVRLLADASTTGGALSSQRVTLSRGADGAAPHTHALSTEVFYVLGGEVQILSGDRIATATAGDLVVVPPRLAHAFGAQDGSAAELLILLTPGVERFGYFRLLDRLRTGQADRQELLDSQQRYDNYFLDSPAWRDARTAPGESSWI